jgi:predicted nucleic acid-binding protein
LILLDTNVVSGMMRPRPEQRVMAWLDAAASGSLFLSSVTVAEILVGIELLPEGSRRQGLANGFAELLARGFGERVLGFGLANAPAYAEVVAQRSRLGRPISQFDAQIASIARVHGMSLATRNISDFEACGIELVNPFE